MAVLVVGSVAFDTIHNHLGTHKRVLGGSAVFASLAASTLGPVQLVGVVGNDYPEEAIALLRGRGIALDGLEIADGQTFHWEGRYAHDLTSRETIQTDLNVFANFEPKIPDAFAQTPYVMLGNIAPGLQLSVLEQVQAPKVIIADTMNLWIDTALDDLKRLISRTDILVINEEEARQLSGHHHPVAVAETLRTLGPETVIVKRGEYGALLFAGDEIFSAPAYPLKNVADPTGAGDAFAGGFIGYLARAQATDSLTLRKAVICGSAVASLCVEAVGISALRDLDERRLTQRMDSLIALGRVPIS